MTYVLWESRAFWSGYYEYFGFPGGSDGKEWACNAGDPGLIPGPGRSPGEGNGNSWTEDPGGYSPWGRKESDMTELLTFSCSLSLCYAMPCWVTLVVSDSVRPHRRQPTRLPRPWDSPGKNTGVGCHFRLQCMKVKSESEVAQSCPTLSDPMDCSLTGSSVHGIFQARVLEWGAI